jgi:probable phosphoglycerate mutase
MKVIVFVRHGKSQANAKIMLTHDLGVHPLTEEGIEQVRSTTEMIAKIPKVDAIYTSPVLRALQTAEIIGKRISVKLKVDARLSERAMGGLNNTKYSTIEELHTRFKKEIESGYATGVESFDTMAHRMKAFADSVRGGVAIAVSHSDPIMGILGTLDPQYGDHDFVTRIPYASMTAIDFENKKIMCVGSASLPGSLL